MNSDQVEEAKSPAIEVVIPTQKERHGSNDTDELEEKPAETQIVTEEPTKATKVMHPCHIPGCGRMFDQKILLDSHFERRHKDEVTKEQMIAQEESKD